MFFSNFMFYLFLFPEAMVAFNFLKDLLFYVYECFVYIYVCVLHVCLVPVEVREHVRFPELWSWMVASLHVGADK